jgi:hypothetical protein
MAAVADFSGIGERLYDKLNFVTDHHNRFSRFYLPPYPKPRDG